MSLISKVVSYVKLLPAGTSSRVVIDLACGMLTEHQHVPVYSSEDGSSFRNVSAEEQSKDEGREQLR